MIYELMAYMTAAPQTGDDFPAFKLMLVGAGALIVAAGTVIVAKIKNNNNDKDE